MTGKTSRPAAAEADYIQLPRYQQIAVDLAERIVQGEFRLGDKLVARSSVASHYKVSFETARRAIHLLADIGIAKPQKGSGFTLISFEKAVAFVNQFKQHNEAAELQKSINSSIERQQQELNIIGRQVNELIEHVQRDRRRDLFAPFQILITDACPYLDKSLADINFWHHTAATIVAIETTSQLVLSPGPYGVLNAGNILLFVGDPGCVERVRAFLYPDIPEPSTES